MEGLADEVNGESVNSFSFGSMSRQAGAARRSTMTDPTT